MRTPSKLVMFTAGTLSGLGIAVATLSGAADSIIPYQFKDGQVISADTLNDLFGQIKNSTQGFSSESELNGAWTCVTYDSTGAASKTAGMPNSNFSTDSTTGLQAISQNWTFSSNGTNLTMNLVKLGGIQSNNTNICGGGTASYNSKIVESSLMLTGVTAGCNNGDGYVLPLNRVSPYKFRFTQGTTVVSCIATNQPPSIPINLSAALGSGGVTLSWTDAGGSPSGFSVLKKSNGAYSQIGTVGSSATTYTDSSGSAGDLYRVKSTNSNGDSLPSTAAIAK